MKPLRIDLEKGQAVAICSCGKSEKTPFCDGSHKGSLNQPHIIKADEKMTVSICTCFHSEKRPFCDGSHKKMAHSCGCNCH